MFVQGGEGGIGSGGGGTTWGKVAAACTGGMERKGPAIQSCPKLPRFPFFSIFLVDPLYFPPAC